MFLGKTRASTLGVVFDDFPSFSDNRNELGMTSITEIHNIDDQCYEFQVIEYDDF